MIWQDLVFMIGSFSLGAAMIPAIWKRQPPPLITCVMTAFWLVMFAGAFASLNLWLSTLGVGITAVMWIILSGIAFWKERITHG
ncbi:hypothetical protein LCGC14_0264740 [marine sediment metagenome]|uniref:Uncharacterized protein n=1 Tax=marine sediment metagenome TaxID=412755 RepID=A0A0F9WLJ7_9ZZZZ